MLLPTFLIQSIIVLSISLNLNVHSNVNIDICNAFKQVTVVDDNELSDGSSWQIIAFDRKTVFIVKQKNVLLNTLFICLC